MKRMQGKIDESDDDANFSGEEQESEGQFFDGDGDLQEVELDDMQREHADSFALRQQLAG